MIRFIQAGTHLIAVDHIVSVDCSEIDRLRMTVTNVLGEEYFLEDSDALDAAMVLNPKCLEGRRLQWAKNAWAVHNLIGHPVMQVLAWLKCYKVALWVHDETVPRPKVRGFP